jgi:hypothetical protein
LSGIGSEDQKRLMTAITAVDAVWDRMIFDHAKTFGGPEVGDSRTLSAAILARLLEVEYVALASAAGGSLPPSGNPVLDEVLEQACHDARNAQALLFRKKDAPSFGLLLRAYQEGHRE